MTTTTPAAGVPALPAGPQDRGPEGDRDHLVTGTLLFVVADLMFFGGLAAAYLLTRSSTAPWPPKGADLQLYVPVVLVLTLVMSAFTAEWAAFALRRSDRRSLLVALFLTMGLGLAFLNGQWFELKRLGLPVGRSAYHGLFLALVGYHMAHLAAAVGAVALVAVRALGGQLTARDGAVRAMAYAWHALVAVWLVVFWLLYLVK